MSQSGGAYSNNDSRNRALAMTAAKLMKHNESKSTGNNLNGRGSTSKYSSNAGNLDSLSAYSMDNASGSNHSLTQQQLRSSPPSAVSGSTTMSRSRKVNMRRTLNRSKSIESFASANNAQVNSNRQQIINGSSSYVNEPVSEQIPPTSTYANHKSPRRQAQSTIETNYESSLRKRLEHRIHVNSGHNKVADNQLDYDGDNEHDARRDKQEGNDSSIRYDYYKRLNKKGTLPIPESCNRTNTVRLHIYDLLETDTVLDMSDTACFQCSFPIGKCFKAMNDGLHCLGTGAYHVGIEVNGVEYAYGMHTLPGMTGVFTCKPKESPGFSYRTKVDFGQVRTTKKIWIEVPANAPSSRLEQSYEDAVKKINGRDSVYRELEMFVEGTDVISEMTNDYIGPDYNLLRKNCCHFARDALIRLGVKPEDIPSWFTNMAEAGVMTEDAVAAMDSTFVDPIRQILSGNEDDVSSYNASLSYANPSRNTPLDLEGESGFEIILGYGHKKVIEVGDISLTLPGTHTLRKTPSWTY